MDLPDRDANSDDAVVYPYRGDRTLAANRQEMAWLQWRLIDPSLPESTRRLLETEVVELRALQALLTEIEKAEGGSLEEKMSDPRQRASLRSLSLRWLRAQQALLSVTTAEVDRQAQSNGG